MQSIFEEIVKSEWKCNDKNYRIVSSVHFQVNPCSHPIFYMNGVRQEVLKAILDYMYLGEVRINQEDLPDFLRIAEEFKIRGVTPVSREIFPTRRLF